MILLQSCKRSGNFCFRTNDFHFPINVGRLVVGVIFGGYDEVAFFDDEDGNLAARYTGKLEMLHGYDAPEEVEKTRSITFLDASRDENCMMMCLSIW